MITVLLLAAVAAAAPVDDAAIDAYVGRPLGGWSGLRREVAAADRDYVFAFGRLDSLFLADCTVRGLPDARACLREEAALAIALRALQRARGRVEYEDARAAYARAGHPFLGAMASALEHREGDDYDRIGDGGFDAAYDQLVRLVPGVDGWPAWVPGRERPGRSVPPPASPGYRAPDPDPAFDVRDLMAGADARDGDASWILRLPAAADAPEGGGKVRELMVRRPGAEFLAACRRSPGSTYRRPQYLTDKPLWFRIQRLPLYCARDHGYCWSHMEARIAGREVDPTVDGAACDEVAYYLFVHSVAAGTPAWESCGAWGQKSHEEVGWLADPVMREICEGIARRLMDGGDAGFCAKFYPVTAYHEDPEEAAHLPTVAWCTALSGLHDGPRACAVLEGGWRQVCIKAAAIYDATRSGDLERCRGAGTCRAILADPAYCSAAAARAAEADFCAFAARFLWTRWFERLSEAADAAGLSEAERRRLFRWAQVEPAP